MKITLFIVAIPITLLVALTGCSARIEVADQPTASGEKTVVGIDLKTTPHNPPPQDQPIQKLVVIGDGNIIVNSKHTHLHFHEAVAETPPSHAPDECARLREQHHRTIRRWHTIFDR
jgi:hypothetical protein